MDWETDPAKQRKQQALASFLITRGPYAFIGSRGLRDAHTGSPGNWDPLFATDVGEPVGLCVDRGKNVFEREWTKGAASFDCNSYTAKLPFSSLPMSEVLVGPGVQH